MKFYWESFKTFFKIGAFTLGGGYAMIPIIEAEVVEKRKWIGKEEFLDLIAIAQSCPGVFAINISVFIGYKLRKIRGAFCTALGTALPSFLIILLIAMFFHRFMEVGWIAAMFRGIRPAVVALIAVPTFNLAKRAPSRRATRVGTFSAYWMAVLLKRPVVMNTPWPAWWPWSAPTKPWPGSSIRESRVPPKRS